MNSHSRPSLRALLEETLEQCSIDERRRRDPVGVVHEYRRRADVEVAALIGSCLAYGRVELLRDAIRHALAPLGEHPARRLATSDPDRLSTWWNDFSYRMTRGADLRDLAAAISTTLKREGSLESLYRSGPTDEVETIDAHLKCASDFVCTLRSRRLRSDLHRGFRYLLPDPADGSACKRLHLFFRWMVRGPNGVDFGLWDAAIPSALIMPLDTHTARLCRYLGLVDRKSVDGKAARRVTEALLELDCNDPLRYDFALCHLGISGRCIHRWCPERCPSCPIEPACTIAADQSVNRP